MARAEHVGNLIHHPAGNGSRQQPSVSNALAHGASATGGLVGRHRRMSTSSPARILLPMHAAGHRAPATVLATLGAGSRLFGSHVPMSPADGSSLSGSSGLTGVLSPSATGAVAAMAAGRPPLPPYGRRMTWTFRTPLTRPG